MLARSRVEHVSSPYAVVLLPGSVLPAEPAYAALLHELGALTGSSAPRFTTRHESPAKPSVEKSSSRMSFDVSRAEPTEARSLWPVRRYIFGPTCGCTLTVGTRGRSTKW